MGATLKRWARHLPAGLGVVLLVGAIYVVQREFRSLKIEQVLNALQAIPRAALVIAFLWTLVSYGILTFYDRLATYYAGEKVSYRRVAFASFCAYALAHNLGFAAVSGAAVRYRLYAGWGLTPLQIGKVVAFCSLTFTLGGMVLGGLVLFIEPESVPFFGAVMPLWSMHAIALGLWAVVAGYVTLATWLRGKVVWGHVVDLPGWRMAIVQVLLATVDVAVTAAIVHALLPHAEGLTYIRFLGVYVASYTAGLAANIPGGIGVFDTAMLVGLEPWLDAPHVLGAIVVFRLYYYIIPLFIAGSLFAANELLVRGRALVHHGAEPVSAVPVTAASPRFSEPDFVVAAVSGVVALCGVLLLCLSIVERQPDFSWVDPDFAVLANPAGEYVPSLIGGALMVCVVALSQRVALAWQLTIGLLLAAAGFTVAQGDPFWIPGVLILAAGLIAPFHSAFYRHAWLLAGPMEGAVAGPLLALAACVIALAASERHVRWLADNSWWEVVLSRDVSNSLRATVALTVVLALAAMYGLLRPRRVRARAWETEERLRYAALGAEPPARADGVVWGENALAGIPFRRVGRVVLGLGDPAGVEGDRISAIWRLRDFAHQEGREPAFWRVGRSYLKVYADLGLTAVPLRADGVPCERAGGEKTGGADGVADLGIEEFLVCRTERDLIGLLPSLSDGERG